MKSLGEQILTNSEVCEELRVSDYHRKQLIARGILDPPIDTGAAFPKHTLSQVIRAQQKLREESSSRPRPGGARKTKPLSRKMAAQIRGYR